ncbi:hypothetical protein TNCV_5058911 [Trichonephila clavipes]|nr:hypothetical protein TNCV_5058911 [Trichonephila clavipes]
MSISEKEQKVTDGRCQQPGIHRVKCIGVGGRHPFWHGHRVSNVIRCSQQRCSFSATPSHWRYTPNSHVRQLGESGQQPRLSPGASG